MERTMSMKLPSCDTQDMRSGRRAIWAARIALVLALVALAVALLGYFGLAHAQAYPPPPPPPPCQSIILPNGKLVMCCTSGTVTNCF